MSQRLGLWFYHLQKLFCSPLHEHFSTINHLFLALVFKKWWTKISDIFAWELATFKSQWILDILTISYPFLTVFSVSIIYFIDTLWHKIWPYNVWMLRSICCFNQLIYPGLTWVWYLFVQGVLVNRTVGILVQGVLVNITVGILVQGVLVNMTVGIQVHGVLVNMTVGILVQGVLVIMTVCIPVQGVLV